MREISLHFIPLWEVLQCNSAKLKETEAKVMLSMLPKITL